MQPPPSSPAALASPVSALAPAPADPAGSPAAPAGASAPGAGPAGLALGPHRVAVPAVLAPMSGVTDAPMRRAALAFGAGYAVSEMVASHQLVRREAEALLKAEAPGTGLHVVQLAGCDPEPMAEAARLAEAAGADVIDINMGCPAKRVANKEAGSALMRDLDHATRIIAAVVGAVGVPVTLKMRLGWDEQSLNAPDLARRAVGEGVVLITVHGRTRQQFYKGRANRKAIRAVVEAVPVPVIANGDCDSVADARRMLADSGASAVMVGRAAVGRPWLVGQIGEALATGRLRPDPTPDRQREALLALHDAWLSHYGTELGLKQARKHVAAAFEAAGFSPGAPSTDHLRLRALTATDAATARQAIADLFDALAWSRAA